MAEDHGAPGSLPGVYILVLRLHGFFRGTVGRLGLAEFEPGFYMYVGSALGPGGLAARVSRHLRRGKRLRWHIDYLTSDPRVSVEAVVYAYTGRRLEGTLSSGLAAVLEPALEGFGSSDTRNSTHLFRCHSLAACVEAALRAMRGAGLEPRVWLPGGRGMA